MRVVADRYRLDHLLGSGGVADVYRARDLVLDRDVAVKVLRESVDETERNRFVGEAKMLARLSHPGLVSVLDAGISDAQPYLVMELVPGSTLAHALRERPLPVERVAAIGAQLALAIAYAHEQQVVHRDVKPANVLLGPAGPKLADFGIARLVGDTARHTKTGTTIGTPAYVSPEQVRGEEVGPPTDVYSLGLVLLEALTGTRAFPGTSIETALARLHRSPEIPAHLPAGWRELLAAMTATNPADRPSAGEAAAQIQGAAAPPAETRVLGVTAGAPAIGADGPPTKPMATPPHRPSRPLSHKRSRIVAVAAAAGVVLATVAAAGLVLDDGDSEEGPGPAGTSSVGTSEAAPSEVDTSASTAQQDETTGATDADQQDDGGKDKGKSKGGGDDKDKGKDENKGKNKGGKGKG